MPAKYRRMADFHEYYSGVRKAPILTIFIGGNHEASNHLFELYYGGWVAPNIYYMGAANILRLGPLRIAGLSGIWKGYDFRKPHFERVPYNESDLVTIFHVRELDVRKMLSVRTQVDIGMSHDWPQGVEWKGDYRWLFRKKHGFEADAAEGKLGSVAAKQCLERLRPAYWFSAHLHVKYAAMIQHGDYEPVRRPREFRTDHRPSLVDPASDRAGEEPRVKPERNDPPERATLSPSPKEPTNDLQRNPNMFPSGSRSQATDGSYQYVSTAVETPEQAQVSAWQNFPVVAKRAEAIDNEHRLRDQKDRAAESDRMENRSTPKYLIDETWKQVQVSDNAGRGAATVTKSLRTPGEDTDILSLEDGLASQPKRERQESSGGSMASGRDTPTIDPGNSRVGHFDAQLPLAMIPGTHATRNMDEIHIDVSDSSSGDDCGSRMRLSASAVKRVPFDAQENVVPQGTSHDSHKRAKPQAVLAGDCDGDGMKLDDISPHLASEERDSFHQGDLEERITDEEVVATAAAPAHIDRTEVEQDVSDAMRAQLAQISDSFAPAASPQPVSAPLPLPEGIANSTTHFLALDKCERGRDFLQLLEIEAISDKPSGCEARPYRLEYDQEWLAILRVFAPELKLGGDPGGRVPSHLGDTYYRERIIEEERWIAEHVVQPGKLTVPENFSVTGPVHNSEEELSNADKPREYTNPQTSAFCELIGIENQFDISEEERDMRMARGPRPVDGSFSRGGRGRGRGRGRGARGWGGRERGRGGRGRGRGYG